MMMMMMMMMTMTMMMMMIQEGGLKVGCRRDRDEVGGGGRGEGRLQEEGVI